MEEAASSVNGAGKTEQLQAKKSKLESFLTPYIKINSKSIKDIKYKSWHCKTSRSKQTVYILMCISLRILSLGIYLLRQGKSKQKETNGTTLN